MAQRIWTIGHSTRSSTQFIELLEMHEIQAVADVRRFPASRRQPQFGQSQLSAALAARQIEYRWFEALGGRRKPRPDSVNTAWRNTSFRGYADYMQTAEFAAAFSDLLQFCTQYRITLMCAELLWWRCHRALISDALCVRGIEVIHITDERVTQAHPYTSAAHVVEGRLSYSSTLPGA